MSKSVNFEAQSETSSIWHKRLGHTPTDIIKSHECLKTLKSTDQIHCTVCPLARHTKLPFPSSTHITKTCI